PSVQPFFTPVCSPFSRPSKGQWNHTIAWPRPERVATAILEWVVCAQSWQLRRGSLPSAYLEAVPAHLESDGPCGLCRERLRQDRPYSERRTTHDTCISSCVIARHQLRLGVRRRRSGGLGGRASRGGGHGRHCAPPRGGGIGRGRRQPLKPAAVGREPRLALRLGLPLRAEPARRR